MKECHKRCLRCDADFVVNIFNGGTDSLLCERCWQVFVFTDDTNDCVEFSARFDLWRNLRNTDNVVLANKLVEDWVNGKQD